MGTGLEHIFTTMDSIPDIIKQNPYRILGVYANTPKMEILAQKEKAMTSLQQGKSLEYHSDLQKIMSPINRTPEMLNKAEASIATAKERIKYAQFWFLNVTEDDRQALAHLEAGCLDEAMTIWSKHDSLSALQNYMICSLIKDKVKLALKTAERLYVLFGNTYVNKVFGPMTIHLTGNELIHMIIDTWGAEIGILKHSSDNNEESTGDCQAPMYQTQTTATTLQPDCGDGVKHKKEVAMLQRILQELPQTSAFFQLSAVDLCLGLINHCFENFNSYKWEEPSHVQQLINQGQAIMANNPTAEKLLPLVEELAKLIPERQQTGK